MSIQDIFIIILMVSLCVSVLALPFVKSDKYSWISTVSLTMSTICMLGMMFSIRYETKPDIVKETQLVQFDGSDKYVIAGNDTTVDVLIKKDTDSLPKREQYYSKIVKIDNTVTIPYIRYEHYPSKGFISSRFGFSRSKHIIVVNESHIDATYTKSR